MKTLPKAFGKIILLWIFSILDGYGMVFYINSIFFSVAKVFVEKEKFKILWFMQILKQKTFNFS